MASGEEFDSIYGETIDQAIKTGFLFSRSLNHYENHTRDELLKQGYSEEIIECAERVLAHFGTSLGSKGGKIPEELWSIRPCADCRTPVDSRIFSDGMWRYGVELCEQCFDKREAKKQCLHCKSKYDDPAVEDDFLGRCKERYVPREKTSEEKETPQCFEEDNDYFTPLRTKGLQKKSEKRKIELRYVCSWCALTEYCIKDYIRNRIEDYGSESTKDSAKLRIKPEKFERYREGKKGEDAGKKWKDYYVEYDSYLYAKFKNPISVEEIRVVPWSWFILHPEDKSKVFKVYRVRIFLRNTLAYLQISFGTGSARPTVDLMNFGSTEDKPYKEKLKEFNKVRQGLKLLYKIKGQGRPEKWATDQLLEAIRIAALQIKNPHFLTQPYIAKEMKEIFHLETNFDRKRLSELMKRKGIEWTELQTQLRNQHKNAHQN